MRKLSECEQVAAVCYRVRGDEIDFLLVRTRGSSRWTFPKGSAEPGLTQAQAAALEAFEEAGVHGRMEEDSFARYFRSRVARKSDRQSGKSRLVVNAFLCQVVRLCTPKESNRNRKWFSAQETKRRLREGRSGSDGAEFVRVVGKAVERIQRLREDSDAADTIDPGHLDQPQWDRPQSGRKAIGHNAIVRKSMEKDTLQKVQFEALSQEEGLHAISFTHRSQLIDTQEYLMPVDAVHRGESAHCEVLPFGTPRQINQGPRLLSSAKKIKALGAGAKIS